MQHEQRRVIFNTMDHVAIITPSWKLIPKILEGKKTIESRWYQTRRSPWNTVSIGDRVFFKDSGKSITAMATASRVWQFEIHDRSEAKKIVAEFGDRICLVDSDVKSWPKIPKYCVLIELTDPKSVQPFAIDKRGFGAGVAWISVDSIEKIKTDI